ncbi:MAG: hypothetical protein ABFC80_02195 [Coriobacteriales bacterium]
MAQPPIRSTADVPGLTDALSGKADDSRFVGFTRLIIAESEPADPQDGDVWLQYEVNHAPAAFTPTVGSITDTGCTITAVTTDPDADSLTYKYQVLPAATAAPAADDASWATAAALTSPQAVTGLTQLTSYKAHVLATDGELGTVGSSASFDTAAATTLFLDDFDDSSLDSVLWGTSKTATPTITESGTTLAIAGNTASANDAALVYLKDKVLREATTYTVKAQSPDSGTGDAMFLSILQKATAPAIDTAANINNQLRLVVLQNVNDGVQKGRVWVYYKTSGGTWTCWSSGTWNTLGAYAYQGANATYYRAVLETTSTQFRILLKSADGTTTHLTTAWVDWTTVCANTDDMYLICGDPYNNANARDLTIDFISKA